MFLPSETARPHPNRGSVGSNRKRQGFTLSEIMIATFVASLTFTMISALAIQSAEIMFTTRHKLGINSDVRSFTQDLFGEAREANAFFLYRSITATDRDATADQLDDGEAGDMLVLVTLEPHPNESDPLHYTEISIYYRDTNEEDEGPVRRINHTFSTPADPSLATVESYVSTAINQGSEVELVDLAKGLANDYLFQNLRDKSVIVNGQIIHGNAAKEVTDTYNFAIYPRN
ncbi:MAG: prepilin-type N-terminal cleavage/methylation domain-containing protein [Opitutales bacterium]